jgi:putative transposase
MVQRAESYRWSSYRHHALGRTDAIVSSHPAYLGLGATAAERQRAWRAISEVPLHADDVEIVRESITKGCSPPPIEPQGS